MFYEQDPCDDAVSAGTPDCGKNATSALTESKHRAGNDAPAASQRPTWMCAVPTRDKDSCASRTRGHAGFAHRTGDRGATPRSLPDQCKLGPLRKRLRSPEVTRTSKVRPSR